MVALKTSLTNVLKSFLNNVHLVKENVPKVEKKRLLAVLPYLGLISLQTRTKLQEPLKGCMFLSCHVSASE